MDRERILAILYEMALLTASETEVEPLLEKFLQRLMSHADFPCGLFLRPLDHGPNGAARRPVLLEAAIGGRRIGRAGDTLSLPAALLDGGSALIADAELLQAAFAATPYRVALRLPVAEQGLFLLLAPQPPSSPLPLATVFEPVLANFAKTLQLCRANAEVTAGLRAEVERHRQTMAERERSEKLLTLVLDTIPDRVFWKDRDGVFLGCNRAFARDAGVAAPSLLVGKTDYDMGWRAQADRYRRDDEDILASGRAKLNFEEQQTRLDGLFWVETSKIPLTGMDGEIIGILGTYEDITERKRIQNELVRAKEAAEQANQAKSEFLTRMSHELRTPLNAVLGFGQLLGEDDAEQPLTADQKDCVDHIVNAGRHLLYLINDILDLAKIEAGAIQLTPEAIELEDLLQECLDTVRPQAGQRGIALVEPSLVAATARADRTRLRQVLLNLLSNAVKYNRPDGTVTVSVRQQAGQVRIAVADTGQGLTAEQQAGLFQPFNRLGAEGGAAEGVGIGLVITKRLVEAMGGSIGVDSLSGVGSTFWFTLPAAAAAFAGAGDASPTTARPVRPSPFSGLAGSKTLLYVEDNPSNRLLVSNLVKRYPQLRLLTAESGGEGLRMALETRPDLLILDINLPDMSGLELLQRLRGYAETRDIKAIALSANSLPEDVGKGVLAGFTAYLTKPLQVDMFVDTLSQLLRD